MTDTSPALTDQELAHLDIIAGDVELQQIWRETFTGLLHPKSIDEAVAEAREAFRDRFADLSDDDFRVLVSIPRGTFGFAILPDSEAFIKALAAQLGYTGNQSDAIWDAYQAKLPQASKVVDHLAGRLSRRTYTHHVTQYSRDLGLVGEDGTHNRRLAQATLSDAELTFLTVGRGEFEVRFSDSGKPPVRVRLDSSAAGTSVQADSPTDPEGE